MIYISKSGSYIPGQNKRCEVFSCGRSEHYTRAYSRAVDIIDSSYKPIGATLLVEWGE